MAKRERLIEWDPDQIPAALKELNQWVIYRLVDRNGKSSKVPYQAAHPHQRADVSNPQTWSEFEAAWQSYVTRKGEGFGFVFTNEDPFLGIDLDHCGMEETGTIESWAKDIIQQLDSYTEWSPSGKGLHIIVQGSLPVGLRRAGKIEMYDQGRYFTFTGHHLSGAPTTINERQEAVEILYRQTFEEEQSHFDDQKTHSGLQLHEDALILERVRSGQSGRKFDRLFQGHWKPEYPSQSEADLAFVSILALYTTDPQQIDRLYRKSPLYRPKWDVVHSGDGQTYGQRTIRKALNQDLPDSFKMNGTSSFEDEELEIFSAVDFMARAPHQEMPWIWRGFILRGDITLLVAPPKMGKSTLTWHLIQAILQKPRFLGSRTSPEKILILTIEETSPHIRKRLATLGLVTGNLFFRRGLCQPTPDFYALLKQFIIRHQIGLLIIDTLTAFWDVQDENNAAQVIRELRPLQDLAHSMNVGILLLHHTNKKREGKLGEEVRGSSAILASVAISITMKGHDLPTQRKFSTRSRYEETPDELLFELRDNEFVSHGPVAEYTKENRLERVSDAITGTPELPQELTTRAGLRVNQTNKLLKELIKGGRIGRMGKGTKGDPYRYFKKYLKGQKDAEEKARKSANPAKKERDLSL